MVAGAAEGAGEAGARLSATGEVAGAGVAEAAVAAGMELVAAAAAEEEEEEEEEAGG